jgi:hypothetical protein
VFKISDEGENLAQRSCNSGALDPEILKCTLMTSDRNNTTRQQLLIHLSLAITKKIPLVQALNPINNPTVTHPVDN